MILIISDKLKSAQQCAKQYGVEKGDYRFISRYEEVERVYGGVLWVTGDYRANPDYFDIEILLLSRGCTILER